MENAIDIDSAYQWRNLYILARIYAEMNEYARASQLLEKYRTMTAGSADAEDTGELATLYAFRDSLVRNPVGFDPKPLPGEVNSPEDEALPALTVDGSRMLFTRYDRIQEDLYVASWDPDSLAWVKPFALSGINSKANEGAPSFSADGSVIAFTACGRPGNYGRCDIFVTRRQPDGTWTKAANAEGLNSQGWDGQPALTADGMAMYFSSDRPGGQGGKDIWYSRFTDDDSWTEPVNCGTVINSAGNEEAPFLSFDDRTLYYMSDGVPGMGDFDIFKSVRTGSNWSAPVNLGYPINTGRREGGLSIHPNGEIAYYTREEEATRRMDIYTFTIDPGLRPRMVSYAIGLVTDAVSGESLSSTVRIYNITDSAEVYTFFTDRNGVFKVSLVHGEDYGMHVSSQGYVFYSDQFSLSEAVPYGRYDLFVELQPLADVGARDDAKPIVLNNIQFEFGDSTLLESSVRELTLVLDMLMSRPDISIRVDGHTDDVGPEESNLALSEARARAVVAWLVDHGIADSRLSYRGFGESAPVASNEIAEGRRKNRRTDLIIR